MSLGTTIIGKEGKAIVDETEKGWFIQYIDRDPKALARQMQAEQRQKYELDEEERHKREIEAQVRAAESQLQKSSAEIEIVDNNLVRTDDADKIAVSLNLDSGNLLLKKRTLKTVFSADDDNDDGAAGEQSSAKKLRYMDIPASSMVSSGVGGGGSSRHFSSSSGHPPLPSSLRSTSSATKVNAAAKVSFAAAEPLSKQSNTGDNKDRPPQNDRKDYWLHKNIFVKVVSESLDKGKLFKQKGVVVRVIDRYLAEVDIDGKVYKIDQDDLETVIPKVMNTSSTFKVLLQSY
jgi:DNA/RNA-binding protein KIN17